MPPGSAGSKTTVIVSFKGFEHYLVSKHGQVYSTINGKKKKLLKSHVSKNGYAIISLKSNQGKRKRFTVHKLVLTAFVGRRPKKHDACHNNGNRSDNRLSNLRWDTRKGNFSDKLKHGTLLVGETHGKAKLNELQARIIRRCTDIEDTHLAEFFKISRGTVAEIKNKEIWKHLSDNPEISRRAELYRTRKKLNILQVRIIKRCAGRVSDLFLSKIFPCHDATIYEIRKGLIWRNI